MSTSSTWATIRARKSQTCDLCSRRIAPGETFRRHAVFDGQPISVTTRCEQCIVFAQLLVAHEWYDAEGRLRPDDVDVSVLNPNERAIHSLFSNGWRGTDGYRAPASSLTF